MSTENKKNIVKMATIYAQEGKWEKAITEYKKLITLDPTDYNIHNMLGDAHAKKGEDALAYQEYIIAAEAYQKQGLADKANILYKKIGRLESEKLPEKDRQKQILIKKHTTAEKFIEGGEIDKAIETYEEILKLSPANFETYQKLGELFAEKGDKEKAQEYYRKIVDIYFKNRLYKRALPIYQKILEMQPDDISAREKIAEIYEREANESDAKREFLFLAEYYWKEKNIEKTDFFAQKAVEFKSIEAHFFKGAALYERKELGEAKKELEMLLKFKATHAGALTVMACISRDMGQMDEALSMFDKVIKAEPENTDAIEELAALYVKKGLNKEAAAKYMLAVSVFNNKQAYEKAAGVLNKALALEPENIDVLSKLGDTYVKQNKKKEAADTYIKISEIYKKEKIPDKAAEYYKMAQGVDPANNRIVDNAKKLAAEPPPAPKAEVKAPAALSDFGKPSDSAQSASDFGKPSASAKASDFASASAQSATADKKNSAFAKASADVSSDKAADVSSDKKQAVPPPPASPAAVSAKAPVLDKPAADKPADKAAPAAPKPEQKAPSGEPPPFKIQHTSSSFGTKPAQVQPPAEPAKAAPKQEQKATSPEPGAFKIQHNSSAIAASKQPAAAQPQKEEEELPSKLPDIDIFGMGGKKPSEKIAEMEKTAPPQKTSFVPPGVSDDDIPSMIAMGDSYTKAGSFDEAIEIYQKALAMDPGNQNIKKKLNDVYSKYAGMPVSQPDAETKKKEEEAKKKAEEEAKKKKEEEEHKRKAGEEAKKKEEEAKKKAEEEAKKKKEEEEKKRKAEEEARKKSEEEAKKKKSEEEAKKKKEEEDKKKKEAAPAAAAEEAVDEEYSDDFVTVTTAEIFIKQGLFTEAEKILKKILKKEPANIEVKMKLDEMKKLQAETEQKGENVMDEAVQKGKQSKVTYI